MNRFFLGAGVCTVVVVVMLAQIAQAADRPRLPPPRIAPADTGALVLPIAPVLSQTQPVQPVPQSVIVPTAPAIIPTDPVTVPPPLGDVTGQQDLSQKP